MPLPPAEHGTRTPPWETDAAEVLQALGTHPRKGLDAGEAKRRLAVFGPNQLESEPPLPAWQRLLQQLQDPLIFLLFAAVAVSFAVWLLEGADGLPFDVIVIIFIILANAVLGYLQEARAEHAVAALQRMATPLATVLRDASARSIPSAEVVPGDILLLSEGDAVAADGRLFEAATLRVAEASLTGESEPVLKDAATLAGTATLGDRLNMVFGGTAVVGGRGRAIVIATGMNTEMGRIAGLLGQAADEATPLQREVRLIGRFLGIAVIVIAIVVMAGILLTSDIESTSDVVDVLLVGVSLAVAAVPEGLPAVLSVVLALGVQRMARENAIVKKLSSVESLGSASVICSDKTGTLTRNEMTVTTVVTGSGVVRMTGVGYRPEGEAVIDDRSLGSEPADEWLLDEVRAVLGGGSLASDASLRESDGSWEVLGDPTEAAFLVAEAKLGLTEARSARFDRVGEVPFTSERKLMSTLQSDAEANGRVVIVTKGAPDILLARCDSERVAGVVRELSAARRIEILDCVEWLADQALRPLAVAYRELPSGAATSPPAEGFEAYESALTYLGMVGIIDPPRMEAAVAVRQAQQAGVRVLMITGDHPNTAVRIASDLGIARPGAHAVTGIELETMDEGSLRAAVAATPVYARVAPQHKLRIVDALQAQGHLVAMTGDGVNDAPALRTADIGIAMGINGSDVTKEAADMILADDNFATIVAAIREGRGIFANIRTFLRFLLSSNIGEVFTMFLGVVAASLLGLDDTGEAVAVPLLATQILWINLLTDTAPALALGVDPPPADVMRHPPRRLSDRIIDAEMLRGIAFVGLVMALATLVALDLGLSGGLLGGAGDIDEARTMAFTTLVLAQLFNCFNARSDETSAFSRLFTNRLLWLAVGVSLLLQVSVVHAPFLNDAFSTTPLSLSDWLLCGALASAVLWADEVRKLLVRRVRQA
ncbi:MAG: cation-translocating P-type ATPase [Dehalococcoidia bacterium]|nr:cation-translocating P-type ATPase [Dehalococcoidia bacterium]